MIQIIQNFLVLNFLELIGHNLDNDGDFEQPWRSFIANFIIQIKLSTNK